MATNIQHFDWNKFWEKFSENPDDIEQIEGLIFRNELGQWITIFVIPNSFEVLSCAIDYNPWTGEKLK